MREEKDMIEINLNTPAVPEGKQTNYFGNIHLAKSKNCGFPYGHYENETDTEDVEHVSSQDESSLGGCSKYASICAVQFTAADEQQHKTLETLSGKRISCLRQMYCPDCQQRLDADSVRFEKLLSCCLPIFPINCVYKCCVRRHVSRKVICNKCGSNLGFWKRS